MTKKRVKKDSIYFSKEENDAVIEYINASGAERDRIFTKKLYVPMTKLVSSIIRRYNLYIPDEDFEDTFSDALSYIVTKMDKYKPERGKKAYSYYGTTVKHYVIGRMVEYAKKQERFVRFDDNTDDDSIDRDCEYLIDTTHESSARKSQYGQLVEELSSAIKNEIDNNPKLNSDDIKVGTKLIWLLNNWQDILQTITIMKEDELSAEAITNIMSDENVSTGKAIVEQALDESGFDYTDADIMKLVYRMSFNNSSELYAAVASGRVTLNEVKHTLSRLNSDVTDSIELFTGRESDKYTKATILYILRESTLLPTPKIHKSLMKFKKVYGALQEMYVD